MRLPQAVKESSTAIQQGKKVYRPSFESDEDRRNQQEIIEQIALVKGQETGHTLHGQCLKSHSPIDYALVREIPNPDGSRSMSPEVMVHVECKHRNIMKGQFRTLILSHHKWKDGLAESSFTGKPFIFAVRFKDMSIHYIKIDKTPAQLKYKIVMGGRTSRKRPDGTTYFDPSDIEMVVHIPMSDLIPLAPLAS